MQISVWEKESFYAPRDVIIAGSGFAGLWCAWRLKQSQPKLQIAIIDRGLIPTGASTRNAGFACFGSVTELMEDIANLGEDAMLQLVEMRYKGLQQMRRVCNESDIDFELCGGYEMFTKETTTDKATLQHYTEHLNRLLQPITGTPQTFRWADEKIASSGLHHITHLIENNLEGYLHSGKLCQLLLQKVQSLGVMVFNGIEVNGFEKQGDHITLHTNRHIAFQTQQLLLCTNAFAQPLLPDVEITPARGQVLLTSPIEGLSLKGTFHYDAGYYYFRNLGNRVLLGGARNKAFEEETSTDMVTTTKIQQELEHFLSAYILPNHTYHITDRWSGIMGMGKEKKPVVRELSPQVFCAVCLGGMGVAIAPVVAEKIAAMMRT